VARAQQVQSQKQSTTNQLATFTYEPSSSASAISGTFDDLPATAAGAFYRGSMDPSDSIDMFEVLDNQLDVLGAQGRFIGSYLFQGPFARRRGGAAPACLPLHVVCSLFFHFADPQVVRCTSHMQRQIMLKQADAVQDRASYSLQQATMAWSMRASFMCTGMRLSKRRHCTALLPSRASSLR
jgi:hypothetical protein